MFTKPTINSVGCYEASTPFNTIVQPGKPYRCIAVRLLSDMELNNDDPFNTIYTPVGITRSDYDKDVDDLVSIITLHGSGGELLYIPNRYLTSLPLQNGVDYVNKTVAVPLGTLPVNLPLTSLIESIRDIVSDEIGVVPDIKSINTSSIVKLPYSDDQILTGLRNAISTGGDTWKSKYLKEVTRNAKLVDIIEKYECYVMNNCCGETCQTIEPPDPESILCQIIGIGDGTSEELYLRKMGDTFCEGYSDATPAPPPDDAMFYKDYFLYGFNEGCPDMGNAEEQFLQNMMGV